MSPAYVTPDKLEEYLDKYASILRERGFDEDQIAERLINQAKNEIVITYTKEWMDNNLNYWIDLIQNVPGGYWIAQELIHQPHCEYEHYNWRGKMSYEKANVGNMTAKRELSMRSYEVYQISKKMKHSDKYKKYPVKEFKIKAEYYVKNK